jgi:hypothetical protein
MKNILMVCCLAAFFSLPSQADAQGLLKKLKDKASKKAEDLLDKKASTPSDQPGTTSATSTEASSPVTTSSKSKPTNKGGAGLTNTTPPDIAAQINDAETAHAAKNFSEARYAIQQALQGIEIQLGRSILKSLPASVNNIPVDTTQDKVMSSQWGWSNLTMQRVYQQDDKELTLTIGSNTAYSGIVEMYFANAAYIQASADKQNIKQVKVKGNKAIIQYDERKGYTLITQIGQTTLIVWECINFSNEQEVMNAANTIDIDNIKKQLGEQ